jgi:hypothetical protein
MPADQKSYLEGYCVFNSDPCLAEARRDYKEFLELDPHSEYAADDKKELQSLPVVPVKPAVFTAAFQYCEKFRERKSWPSRRPGTQVLDLLFAMLLSLILWRSSLFITVISHPETLTG